ncbi:hypothetical protein PI125_g11736 [Phytophthora idaei]|nr:hypothetical protein PI125_g11736 [Phytophthora idaei]
MIPNLKPAPGQSTRDIHDKANTLADVWSPILQQSSALKEDITRVCGWVRPDNTEAGAKVVVVDTISPGKVAAAIAEVCLVSLRAGPTWQRLV